MNRLLSYIEGHDFTMMRPLLEEETQIYKKGQLITYITDPYYAISILTDTT